MAVPDPASIGVTTHAVRQAIVLEPRDVPVSGPGFLFFPGARVRPEAYIDHLALVAREGFRVVIVRLPFDLAILAPRRGEHVLRELGEAGARTWVVGGHSLGGVVAAGAARRGDPRIVGLVLFASYPADSGSLADRNIPVLSLYASGDGLATPDEIRDRARLLPADTRYVLIEGGNHAGFGSYGPQRGDGVARISPRVQHGTSAAEIVRFLRER